MSIMKFLVAFLLLVCRTQSLKECEKTSKWSLSGKVFPKDFAAKVKLVAYLKANCAFCKSQSFKLGELYQNMTAENYNVSFLIVNSHDQAGKASVFEKSKLTVLQDIEKINVWKKYNVETDDMLIFDKCDRLVKHLKLPESIVRNGTVRKAVLEVYNNDICGSSCTPRRKSQNTKTLKLLTNLI